MIDAKILNPVHIRLGKNYDTIMDGKNSKVVYPIDPGAILGGEHYGFVLIIDHNGKQKEIIYPTECRVEAVGIQGDYLNIFEEGKKATWIFDKIGKMVRSASNEFIDKYRTQFNTIFENSLMFCDMPILKNPINIKIARNPEESVIVKDENIQENYPLYPGVMLGTEHYGFILTIDTDNGQKEMIYPTQNRIDAVGIEGNAYNDLKIFEKGKYHPWLFTFDGKLKNKSSYNQYSKRDVGYVEELYHLNSENSEYCFTLKKKK